MSKETLRAQSSGHVDAPRSGLLVLRSILPMIGGPTVLVGIASYLFLERSTVPTALTLAAAALFVATISRAHVALLRAASKGVGLRT